MTTHPSITTPLADFGLLRSAGPALGPRWAMSGLTKQGPKDSSRAEENKHTQDTYAGKYVFLMKYVPTHTVSIFMFVPILICIHTRPLEAL